MGDYQRDLYQRAYNVCYDALLVIAVYGNRRHEDYLRDNGMMTEFMAQKSENTMEYLRAMDVEIAEIAINKALGILAKLNAPTPPEADT